MYDTFEEAARRYAKAVFESAQDVGKLDIVADNMQTLAQTFQDSPDLQRAVRTPGIKPEQYSAVFQEICTRMQSDALVNNFMQLLCRRKRVFLLPSVVNHFQSMMSEMRGEMQAKVVSATPLSTTQLETLTAALQPFAGKGKVFVSHQMDESLIGGFTVLMGAQLIDLSVKSCLEAINTTLSEA